MTSDQFAREVRAELDALNKLKAGMHPAVVITSSPFVVHIDGGNTDLRPTANTGTAITPGDTGICFWQPPVLFFIKTN